MTAEPSAPAAPFYAPVADEVALFEAAWRSGVPIMLKGPTGVGKTRLVEHMAARLGVVLHTVSCHEDMTATDLLGRFVLTGGETTWVDGPLTQAVKEGGICYLDEIVEARQDAIVAIHSLADHRRELHIERLGGLTLRAAPGFGLVVSYNPGYQSVLKDLKVSTRQRMIGIELGFPPPDLERRIITHEAGVDDGLADDLVRLAAAIRQLRDAGLQEGASTRTLITAAVLIREGVAPRRAALAAMAVPLTDDERLLAGMRTMIEAYLPGEAESGG